MSAYKYYEDADEQAIRTGQSLDPAEQAKMAKIYYDESGRPIKQVGNFIPNNQIRPTIEYKYNEGKLIQEIQSYVDATYDQHYSRNKFQATEFIIDAGHGTGFNIGNMMKYTQRYGRKGDPAEWRKDLMKVIHYAIMQLHVHDTEYKD